MASKKVEMVKIASPIGYASKFNLTPETVKSAGNKPVGSYCPHCGSGKVDLALKEGTGRGSCKDCKGKYAVRVNIGKNKVLQAAVYWNDKNAAKFLTAKIAEQKKALAAAKEMQTKKAALETALKKTGLTSKFAQADLAGKAHIVAVLADKGYLGKK